MATLEKINNLLVVVGIEWKPLSMVSTSAIWTHKATAKASGISLAGIASIDTDRPVYAGARLLSQRGNSAHAYQLPSGRWWFCALREGLPVPSGDITSDVSNAILADKVMALAGVTTIHTNKPNDMAFEGLDVETVDIQTWIKQAKKSHLLKAKSMSRAENIRRYAVIVLCGIAVGIGVYVYKENQKARALAEMEAARLAAIAAEAAKPPLDVLHLAQINNTLKNGGVSARDQVQIVFESLRGPMEEHGWAKAKLHCVFGPTNDDGDLLLNVTGGKKAKPNCQLSLVRTKMAGPYPDLPIGLAGLNSVDRPVAIRLAKTSPFKSISEAEAALRGDHVWQEMRSWITSFNEVGGNARIEDGKPIESLASPDGKLIDVGSAKWSLDTSLGLSDAISTLPADAMMTEMTIEFGENPVVKASGDLYYGFQKDMTK